RLIYLDSAATSQKPRRVIDAMTDFYEHTNAAVHRSVHMLGEESTSAYEGAREKIARFVNAPDPRGVVFTRGTTEATNLVAYAWARRSLREGDEIVSTVMEHHSNIVPWQMTAADTGATLNFLDITDDGELRYDLLETTINERTKLVCVTGMSNVLGTINDIGPIVERAKAVGALVLVDGAQLAPHVPTDFRALGCDFLAFSSHKMLGPTGIGVLVARPELLDAMDPYVGGGEMISNVTLEGSTWADIPYKFEGGTMMVAEAIGFGAAIDYLNDLGMEAVREHEIELARYGIEKLTNAPGVVVYGPTEPTRRGAVFSFNVFDGDELIHPHDVATILDGDGIAVRAGHHCAKPLMTRYGVPATNRASCYVYNNEADIDALVESIGKARVFFSR
ncbi:MAG: SufS family cysteine desulfurase, partial [Actinobacteria bacterium]|nr:SufS family cysteine desulfurase [Actinomycetota bacterium]